MHKSFINSPPENKFGENSFSQQSNLIPNFLMGGRNVQEASNLNQTFMPQNSFQSLSQVESKPFSNIKRQESVRRNAPPITNTWNKSPAPSFVKSRALMDDFNSFKTLEMSNRSFNQNSSIRDSESYNRFVQLKGEDEPESPFENWVTVYGFPNGKAQEFFNYFSQIGPISDKIISNTGNWMHLLYESKMHAVAALNKNGRILYDLAMIAVKPCDDKIAELPNTGFTNQLSYMNQSMGNINASVMSNDTAKMSNGNVDNCNVSRHNGTMRSLVATNHQFETAAPEAPKKGLLKRALSVVFWN